MARSWLSIRIELVDGAHAPQLWPRPGRILIARRTHTFRDLAEAINDGFARWDRAHLHMFTMRDGTQIIPLRWWDDADPEDLDDEKVKLSRLEPGEQFAFTFDLGDEWDHLCSVGPERVDPYEVYGTEPDQPVAVFGWGAIPDQYGRRWAGDDTMTDMPPPPDPPFSDLPRILPSWGLQA